MLDLLISYINFLILSLKYIVKRFTFRVPVPPGYISVRKYVNFPEEIRFLRGKKPKLKYIKLGFDSLDYNYKIIKDENEISFPITIFRPTNHYPICVIYCHGNSCDIGTSSLECYDIAMNINCLVINFEYPGYGICKNQPLSENETYNNLQKTYLFVRKNLGYTSNQIIIYGFSLGTSVAFDLACKKNFPFAGLILQSPLLSVMRVIYNIKKTKYFDMFNNCDKAKFLKTLTFFIHGNKDLTVPYIHGRILAKIIPQKYLYDFYTVDGAGHNNLFRLNKEVTYQKIKKFIQICTGYNKEIDSTKENGLLKQSTNESNNTDLNEKQPCNPEKQRNLLTLNDNNNNKLSDNQKLFKIWNSNKTNIKNEQVIYHNETTNNNMISTQQNFVGENETIKERNQIFDFYSNLYNQLNNKELYSTRNNYLSRSSLDNNT